MKRLADSKILIALYIISFSIAFISKIGTLTMPQAVPYGISLFWIALAVYKLIKSRFNIDKNMIWLLGAFILPRIVVHVYSIALYLFGKTDYMTRNSQAYIVVFAVFAVIYIFGEDILENTITASVISYFIVIIYDTFMYGIHIWPENIASLISGVDSFSSRLFEVHDYTFAIGYIVIFYVFYKKTFLKKDIIQCSILILFMLLGLKRIQVIAVILIILFRVFIGFIDKKYIFKIFMAISAIFVAGGYTFIYMLSDSQLFALLSKYSINSMGRNYYYEAVIKLCKFNVFFPGIGRNHVSELFRTKFSYLKVGGVHSDILKYYAEVGFILFGLWMLYYLVLMPIWVKNKFNLKSCVIYFVLTIYSFMIYYTDNIDTYFVCQFICILIISTVILMENKKKDRRHLYLGGGRKLWD